MENIEKENEKCSKYVATGIVIGKEINQAIDSLGSKYAKPDKYTGNRKLYDSPQAKINAKSNAYRNGGMAKDPYTGKDLFLKKEKLKLNMAIIGRSILQRQIILSLCKKSMKNIKMLLG